MQISLLGDLHLGNRAAKIDIFKGALWRADKIILMGDLIEGITKKDLGGNYGLGFVCLALKSTLKAGIMR